MSYSFKSRVDAFDHALVGVADLELARTAYERLGFTICPRGRHIGWGTANYCIMFPDDYLELLGIVDTAQFTNNLDDFLDKNGEGLLGMCFASGDIDALSARLKKVGGGDPTDLKRLLELPEGTVMPRFRLLYPPADAMPGLAGFFCQHLSPELMRRPEWLVHANGAIGIASATVAVRDVTAATRAYDRIFGEFAVRTNESRADDCQTEVVLNSGRLRIIQSKDGEGLVDLAVRVADIEATADYLDHAGVSFAGGTSGLIIAPTEACGAKLKLVP